MNIYMLKKEIKYLLKNPIFYLGIIIMMGILFFTLVPYFNLYKNVRSETSKIQYDGEKGIIEGYIPTESGEQWKCVFKTIYDSLVTDFNVSEEDALNEVKTIEKMDTQEEIVIYLSGKYEMSKRAINNVFEIYAGKHATENEMKFYLKQLFSKSTYAESVSYKYIDYLGIGLIYFSIIIFGLVFMKDMKKDVYSLLHTKPLTGREYETFSVK